MAPERSVPGPTLYVMRHGETDWNRVGRYQGHADIPLNRTGREQASAYGKALARLVGDPANLDFVASPLSRARETMELVREALGLPRDGYALEPRLREIHYGNWEAQLATELPRTDPEGLAMRARDPVGWKPRGGESYAEMQMRTDAWLREITRDTVVVTHGGPSRTLRASLLEVPPAKILCLEVPQDRFLVLSPGVQRWVKA